MADGVDGQCGALADGEWGDGRQDREPRFVDLPSAPCLSTPFRIRQRLAQPCQPEPAISGVKQTVRKPDRAVDAIDAYLRPLLSLAAARLCRSQALDGPDEPTLPATMRIRDGTLLHAACTGVARLCKPRSPRGCHCRPDSVPGAEVDALQHRSGAFGAVDRDAEGRIRLWSGLRPEGRGCAATPRGLLGGRLRRLQLRQREQPMRSWGHRWRVPCSP
jgi:hypothetical protein